MKLLVSAAALVGATYAITESVFDLDAGICNLMWNECITEGGNPASECHSDEGKETGQAYLCTGTCHEVFFDPGNESNNFDIAAYDDFCPSVDMERAGKKKGKGKANGQPGHCPPGGCSSFWDLSGIWQYGCWCNFDEYLTEGSGQPVNVYDDICKSFQLCLRCARWDGKQENYACDPTLDPYNVVGFSNFKADCSAANPGDLCGESLCSCNVNFLQRLFRLLWVKPSPYTNEYLHSEGFDQEANCPDPAIRSSTMSCCGYYPDRFPYSLGSSSKACCREHRLYNPVIEDCCPDGRTESAGSC